MAYAVGRPPGEAPLREPALGYGQAGSPGLRSAGLLGRVIAGLVYLAMAAFVAWGRYGPGSFTRPAQRGALDRARLRRMARAGLPGRGRLVS